MSWNDNNKFGEKLETLDFNFNKDLAELAQPIEYPEGPEDDGKDEDDEDEEF
jgi:hypothetical protein